jgi:hypothetical protein
VPNGCDIRSLKWSDAQSWASCYRRVCEHKLQIDADIGIAQSFVKPNHHQAAADWACVLLPSFTGARDAAFKIDDEPSLRVAIAAPSGDANA